MVNPGGQILSPPKLWMRRSWLQHAPQLGGMLSSLAGMRARVMRCETQRILPSTLIRSVTREARALCLASSAGAAVRIYSTQQQQHNRIRQDYMSDRVTAVHPEDLPCVPVDARQASKVAAQQSIQTILAQLQLLLKVPKGFENFVPKGSGGSQGSGQSSNESPKAPPDDDSGKDHRSDDQKKDGKGGPGGGMGGGGFPDNLWQNVLVAAVAAVALLIMMQPGQGREINVQGTSASA